RMHSLYCGHCSRFFYLRPYGCPPIWSILVLLQLQLFSIVLISNHVRTAIRFANTFDELRIRSVAVYPKADQEAAHVRFAQQAVLLGETSADSYLNPQAVVQAAVDTGAEAIHPGYGFISENVELARACKRAGITFIGPNE